MFALVVGCAAVLSGAATTAAAPVATIAVLPGAFIGIETATEADGLKVTQTLALCPAAEAGIKRGDRLTQLNGRALRSLPPLLAAQIQAAKPGGKPFELTVEGAQGTRTIAFTPAPAEAEPEGLEVEVAEGAELKAELAASDGALRVVRAQPGGVIGRANLRQGDEILHVDCKTADDPQALEIALAELVAGERQRVTLGVERQARGRQLVILVRAEVEQDVAKEGAGEPIRIEAEAFTGLAGSAFFVEDTTEPAVSGGKLIRLPSGYSSIGSVSTSLAQHRIEPGTYEVAVTFVDEADGTSRASLQVGGKSHAWLFDRNTGGDAVEATTLRTVTFGDVAIGRNMDLVLSALVGGLEGARIDYVELTRTGELEGQASEESAKDDRGPHLRVGGVAVTFTRRVTANHAASDPTRAFTERDKTIFIAFQNESGQYLRADVDVFPQAVHGFEPSEPYWRGAWAGMAPGQRNSVRLDGPASGLIPGQYRVAVRVGGVTRSATFNVQPDHPFATTVDDQFEQTLGPNIALAALGAEVRASSSWNDVPSAHRLIDGFDWIRDPGLEGQCINCGWATRRGDRRPTVTVDLAGDRPAEISTVIVDTRQFWPEGRSWDWVTGWLPKAVAVSVSETGEPDAFIRVATASLHRDRLRQAIELPEGTLAKSVRLEVLENVSGDAGAAFVELEVREAAAASPSIIADTEINLAMPALGGALVRYTGYWDKWPASRLFDGDDGTSWVSDGRYFPQDFTIAFKDDQSALVDHVRLTLEERSGPDTWPSEVAISLSPSNPLDGFVEIGRFPVEKRAGAQEFPVGQETRFVKVRLLDNHGADKTTLSEIAVIEGRRQGYTSVLLREAETPADAGTEPSEEAVTDSETVQEAEPNDTLAEAGTLAMDVTLQGQIDPLGELDSFALPDLGEGASALTLNYSGRPYIRHRLSLLDGSGDVISHFDPGDLPARDARLTFQLTGNESFLQLSEPPASVVVIWDTSGSMQGSEQGLERAVREYIRRAPSSQKINLIRFSNDVEVLLPNFTSDKSRLQAAIGGKFRPNGGTRLYDAVLEGMKLMENVQGNRAILVMTDGEDNGRTWHDVLWRKVERDRIRLYTIGLGTGLESYSAAFATSGKRILRHLALGTNGDSFFAAESAALSSFYGRIADELSRPATYFLQPTVERGSGMLRLVATGEQVPSAAMPAVHLIYDLSGSMSEGGPGGQPKYVLAQNAIYAALDSLPDGAPFGFTVYGARIPERVGKEQACKDIVTLQELGPLNKQAVKDFVARERPRGGTTPVAGSIRHVAERFDRQNREKGGIIIAVTDGIEECDPDPAATIGALKQGKLEYLELNVVGFALKDPEARKMMETIAEIGGGRYFDAADSDALAEALKEAMAARYDVRDAADRVVASGTIDGGDVTVPAGFYRVDIAAAGAPIQTRDVRIDHDHVTTVRVNKVGSEVDVVVEEPRSVADTRQARRDCGAEAAGRDPAERTRRVQEKLNQLGFDAGAADNQPGPRTRRAIQAFQEHHGLPASGEIGLQLEQQLDCVVAIGEPGSPATVASGQQRFRLATSKSLDLDIYAEHGGSGWCTEELHLRFEARDSSIYGSSEMAELLPKLATVIESECASAQIAMIKGYVRGDDTAVYQNTLEVP